MLLQSLVHGDGAHEKRWSWWKTRWSSLMIYDGLWTHITAMCTRRGSSCWYRALCTATELMKNDEADEEHDEASLRFMIDCELILEPCARGERAHFNTKPCARRRSSWTTLTQTRHRLFISFEPCAHGDRAFVNQLIDNDEHRSWFVSMVELVL